MVRAERIVVATGSEQSIAPIDGLAESGYWTSRQATTAGEVPESLVVLGGGPVGVELGQLYRRLGPEVTMVQAADGLVPREDAAVGEIMAGVLAEEGIDVRLGARAVRVSHEGSDRVVHLEDGGEARGRALLVATGRRPRVAGLGLERLGVQVGERGIVVDEHCRAADGVWAVGGVTGVLLFTHVGMYQARVACADIAGRPARADYSASPWVVFSDPDIAAVGLSEDRARERGVEILTSRIELQGAACRTGWRRRRRRALEACAGSPCERGALFVADVVLDQIEDRLGTALVLPELDAECRSGTCRAYETVGSSGGGLRGLPPGLMFSDFFGLTLRASHILQAFCGPLIARTAPVASQRLRRSIAVTAPADRTACGGSGSPKSGRVPFGTRGEPPVSWAALIARTAPVHRCDGPGRDRSERPRAGGRQGRRSPAARPARRSPAHSGWSPG